MQSHVKVTQKSDSNTPKDRTEFPSFGDETFSRYFPGFHFFPCFPFVSFFSIFFHFCSFFSAFHFFHFFPCFPFFPFHFFLFPIFSMFVFQILQYLVHLGTLCRHRFSTTAPCNCSHPHRWRLPARPGPERRSNGIRWISWMMFTYRWCFIDEL